jgi:hypothetical protein
MADPYALFRQKAPWLMSKLIEDFEISVFQAAAIAGNAGYESNGFRTLQELHPWAGRGGYGWFQWTGPRRRAFEEYCQRNERPPAADDTNYAFLFCELNGDIDGDDQEAALAALRKTTTLAAAVEVFEKRFEGAGVPAIKGRDQYAVMAQAAYEAQQKGAA